MLSIISKLTFLHNIFSKLIISLPVFFTHNFSKYMNIKNAFYNLSLDQISGDCIEFGIFTGSSFKHAIRVDAKFNKKSKSIFYGLDSFEGFPVDNHDFYTDQNFDTSRELVEKNFKRFDNVKIVQGYFEDSLIDEKLQNIKKISFAFIDCDIYESAEVAFRFIKDRLSNGAFVMIDDFTSVDKNGNYIAKSFFDIFDDKEVVFFDNYSNGQTFRILN